MRCEVLDTEGVFFTVEVLVWLSTRVGSCTQRPARTEK